MDRRDTAELRDTILRDLDTKTVPELRRLVVFLCGKLDERLAQLRGMRPPEARQVRRRGVHRNG